ncbi:MAG: nuclear transport factor 2 family protein [Gemmatimonadetes bacterium]|nr:nuclear transport factor 2 family protein [Gemmatimonadota bacterium]
MAFRFGFVLLAAPAILAAPVSAQSPADKEGVRAAVLDYVEGFYEGDSTRFLRSVRPEVDKFGFWKNDKGAYQGGGFPWTRFFSFARDVKAGKTKTPPNAPKQIEILDVQDQTAAAKLTAYWGTDYFLLAKYDGKWMIRHIIWQSLPPTP